MSLDIRTAALQLAATLHKDADEIIKAAEKFATFLAAEAKAIVVAAEKDVAAVADKVSPGRKKPTTQPAAPAAATPPAQAAALPAAVATNPDTRGACTKAVITLVQKQAKATAIKVLATFGVEKVPQLKEEQLADALAALNAAIAALPAA